MKLPATLSDIPEPLYVFDGYCVLCSGFVDFCLRHDGDGRLKFTSSQSALGHRIVSALGLPHDTLDRTVLLIEGRTVHVRSTAALRSLSHLKGWPRLLRPLLRIPAGLRDPVYDLIARNRYRWFGRRTACYLPTSQTRPRFIGL